MNIQTEIKPFNSYAAYQQEREYSRGQERLLLRAILLLRSECDRREGRGEDVNHIRAFIREASQ